MRGFFLAVCIAAVSPVVFSQDIIKMSIEKMQEIKGRDRWVDSVFNALTDEQRVAQLFMVAAYSNRDEKHRAILSRKETVGCLRRINEPAQTVRWDFRPDPRFGSGDHRGRFPSRCENEVPPSSVPR